MAALDDLKTAIGRLNASVSAEIKAVAAKLSEPTTSDADVEAAAGQLNTLADTVDAETATLTGSPAKPAA